MLANPLLIGIGRDGCYTRWLQTQVRSVLAILAKGVVKPGFACTYAGHLYRPRLSCGHRRA